MIRLRLPLTLLLLVAVLIACSSPIDEQAVDALLATGTPAAATDDQSTTAERPGATATPAAAPPGSETVAVTFLRAWEQGDYETMYDQLTNRSRALVPFETFVATYTDALNEARIENLRAQPLAADQAGNSAEIAFRTIYESTIVDDISRENEIPLLYENGRWGINWSEGLVFPELAGGNRLQMEIYPVQRASIYDRGDTLLAAQQDAIRVEVIPAQLEDEAGFLGAISPLLNMGEAQVRALYENKPPEWRTTLGVVPKSLVESSYQTLAPYFGVGLEVPGANGRTYLVQDVAPTPVGGELAEGEDAAPIEPGVAVGVGPHLVGYTGAIPGSQLSSYLLQGYQPDARVGLAGIEAWAEPYLRGTPGGVLRVMSPAGASVGILQEVEARPARNVHATFDADVQMAVQAVLEDAIRSHPDGQRGAIVVLDVNSGDVLAMATYPTYDPSVFNEIRPNADDLTNVLNDPTRPLLNRAAQGAYPPGSTFKIMTMASGMQHGMFAPDTRYTCSGVWTGLGPDLIKYDWLQGGHGTITLSQALTRSCNPYFYEVGFVLDGVDPFLLPNTARAFGLGQPTGIQGIAEEQGIIPDPEWKLNNLGEGWSPGDAVNMAIGQGYVLATPLQMAVATAAVANGGTIYQPNLVSRIEGAGGVPEEIVQPVATGSLPISAEQLSVIQQSMDDVTDGLQGTAVAAFRGLPLSAAGKTGTAQVPDPSGLPHAWFTGYAPVEATTTPDGRAVAGPEIAVTVIMENAGEGSQVAAPVFRRVLETFYGLEPTPFLWEQ